MSRRPIALSPDLRRLRDEGYDIDIRHGYLLIRDVPYVNDQRAVQRGTLISKLDLAGDTTERPKDHVAHWTGEYPCHHTGEKIRAIENSAPNQTLAEGVHADFMFSAMAPYTDYHHKMTTYIGRIAGEAEVIEPGVTAKTFPAIGEDDPEGVFKYVDTASSRAGIVPLAMKLAGQRIGIVGLGGTGAYILDLVAKTPVEEIHLFDADVFSQHNAFRAPGAPTIEQLQAKPRKVAHLKAIYENMRNGIVVHDTYLGEDNVGLLDNLDYCFVCMDTAAPKRHVVDRLIDRGVPFVEVGMGIDLTEQGLQGLVRVTACTPDTVERARPHMSFSDGDVGNLYATNIQIAELNALNAALAVIHWKKHFGVYVDRGGAYYAGYSIPRGGIVIEGVE